MNTLLWIIGSIITITIIILIFIYESKDRN